MPAEAESKRESWLAYATVALVLFPSLYAISWGPVASLAENHAIFCEIAGTAYAPMKWLECNTPLSSPLGWYWDLFSSLRPALPSAYYGVGRPLQYFPPGPEFKLTRQVEAIEEYKRRQQADITADEPIEAGQGVEEAAIRRVAKPGTNEDDGAAVRDDGADARRTRELINTSENLRRVPGLWEKVWFLDSPEAEPTQKAGAAQFK